MPPGHNTTLREHFRKKTPRLGQKISSMLILKLQDTYRLFLSLKTSMQALQEL
jgi:hypothetical protein